MNRSASARSAAARAALRAACRARGDVPEDGEAALTDLLADLRHLCDAEGLAFAEYDRVAHRHYLAERQAPAPGRTVPTVPFVKLRACHARSRTSPAIVMGDAPGHYRPFAEVPNTSDPAEANRYADLFAASPRLLEAARFALDELEVWQMSAPDDESTAAALELLRAAIAEAEGGTP